MKNIENFKDGGCKIPQYDFPTKMYCQTLNLIDDAELIAKYREVHDNIWKEIPQGIREVGILEMKLFILGNTVVMIVITPADFDWDKQMTKLATLPKQQEWEDYVALIQKCRKGATSNEKWQMMEEMFTLEGK